MESADNPVLVYTTFASEAEARDVGHILIERRLAACIHINAGITSIYEWEGKRQVATEVAVIIKTRHACLQDLLRAAKDLHSYSNPALMAIDVPAGSPDFFAWIREQTKPHNSDEN